MNSMTDQPTMMNNLSTKLFILHGWGQNKNNWEDFVGKFPEYNPEALDLPGFGEEPLVSTEWGVPEYAQWVREQIESSDIGVKNVILLGHSFGGRISAYLASQNPEWLKGLILCGAPCLYRPSQKLLLRIKAYKLAKKVLPSPFVRLIFYTPSLNKAESNNLNNIFRKVVPFDQTEALPQIQVPTLIFWGELDEQVPLDIAEEMNNLIPNSTLIVAPGSGHQAMQESPYLAYGTVKNFLQEI